MKKLSALVLGSAFVITGCVCPHGPHDGGRGSDGSAVAAAPAPHRFHGARPGARGGAHPGERDPARMLRPHDGKRWESSPGKDRRPGHRGENTDAGIALEHA